MLLRLNDRGKEGKEGVLMREIFLSSCKLTSMNFFVHQGLIGDEITNGGLRSLLITHQHNAQVKCHMVLVVSGFGFHAKHKDCFTAER